MSQTKPKPFVISKKRVMEAFRAVKKNAGSAGVDDQSIQDFEENLKDNLYKIWNRMSSGTYFPPPVKAVPIPKKSGGSRTLGIPTVSDRVAQMVVKMEFEPLVEPHFLADSYGYRPGKSALDAVGVTRERCWHYDWVLEFDIKGLFDNISHERLMKAVEKHTANKWVTLYIKRWLNAPMEQSDGVQTLRAKGVPQGGVISPVLSNLYMHYAFDVWITRNHPTTPWCRYADDGLLHCRSLLEAQELKTEIEQRFKECGLELHPDKTKIVYCKDGKRNGNYPETKFDFLGYTFQARGARGRKQNTLFTGFLPAVSKSALKSMRAKIRQSRIRSRTELKLHEIAGIWNPILRGWLSYYGRYYPSKMDVLRDYFNAMLMAWAKSKFKKIRTRTRAAGFVKRISKQRPMLFVHWQYQMANRVA